MILSIDIERKPNNILSYLLVKTLYLPKVPQATEIFILPFRASKMSMKDRLVDLQHLYTVEGEISAELLCIWLLFSVEDCAVNDSGY